MLCMDFDREMVNLKKRKSGIGVRLLHLLLCICLAAGAAIPSALPVSAAGGKCGSTTTWDFSNGTLTLDGSGAVSIVAWAGYSKQITSVVIGDNVTSVMSSMFANCTELESISIGKSVKTIPSSFCVGCSSLRSIKFSEGLEKVEQRAFQNCVSLKSLNLPGTLKEVGAQAFLSCIDLNALTIPDSVTTIGAEAFKGNNAKTLTLGSDLQTIGKEAFNFSCFPEAEIPDSVTQIGENAFGMVCSSVGSSGSKLSSSYYFPAKKVTIIGKAGGVAQQFAQAGSFPFQVKGAASHTHSWSDWKEQKKAGCETEGQMIRTCSGCGESETKSIPATGHKMGEWKTDKAPSCEADGLNVRTCSVCGKKETQTIPATGHSWGEWKITKEPTVDAPGVQESVCTVCGKSRTAEIAKLVGYTVSVSVSEGGSVTPSGETKVAEGGRVTLKITADQGYQLASVYVNGSEMRTDSSGELLLQDIRSNQNVSVVFQKKEQPKTRKCNFVDITPKRAAWLNDEGSLSMKDFTISANISEKGMVSWLDITADCVPAINGMPESKPYGTGTVSFRYQGNDAEVKEYLQQNSITGQIPLYLRGDGDVNGEVDVVDAETALNSYVVRLTGAENDGISEVQRAVMDVDNNGETTLEDAAYILQYYTQKFIGLTPDWKQIINRK